MGSRGKERGEREAAAGRGRRLYPADEGSISDIVKFVYKKPPLRRQRRPGKATNDMLFKASSLPAELRGGAPVVVVFLPQFEKHTQANEHQPKLLLSKDFLSICADFSVKMLQGGSRMARGGRRVYLSGLSVPLRWGTMGVSSCSACDKCQGCRCVGHEPHWNSVVDAALYFSGLW